MVGDPEDSGRREGTAAGGGGGRGRETVKLTDSKAISSYPIAKE